MKIDDSMKKTAGLTSGTPARVGKGAERAAAPSGAGKAASPAPSASVSGSVTLSSQLQALSAQVASANVFDASKVAEIKDAIASGKFRVDPEKVANGLLESVSDLIHARRKG